MEKKKIQQLEKTNALIITEENNDIDVLNRQAFINQILQIIEYYAEKKQSVSFSIQGAWGSGKSWIINKVYNEIYKIQDFENFGFKYCIFSYNAWSYDYYDEPLLSLFISIYKQLNNEEAILIKNQKTRENVRILFNTLKELFLEDLKSIPLIETIINFKEKYDIKKEETYNKIRQYDYHFDLNQIMEATIKGLNRITNEKTLLIFVDELDRCLPEYAIKVLERIHHINQNLNNIQIIYSIDRNQLSNTIQTIFGNADPDEYLSKFIDFGLDIENGKINENFEKKYQNLMKPFNFIYTDEFSIKTAFSDILPNLAMRTRNRIIKKIELINSFLISENQIDISILYTELFLSYIFCKKINLNDIEILYNEEENDIRINIKKTNFDSFIYRYFDYLDLCNPPITYIMTKTTPATYIKKVIYNQIKDIIKNEIGLYSSKKEAAFYYDSFQTLYMLAPGEINHFGPIENRQFQTNKKSHCHNS